MISKTNPELKSWIEVDSKSDFPIQNIPFGIARHKDGTITAVTRIGDFIIDLAALERLGYFLPTHLHLATKFRQNTLNDFIAMGQNAWRAVRNRIIEIFQENNPELRDKQGLRRLIVIPSEDSEMLMPVKVTDYTDFYSSIEHATNIGKMLRDPENALLPNWRHLPVGYHGRASSIFVSGTNIHRPKGQTMPHGAVSPAFGPSKMLDFELEVAFVVGSTTQAGESITTEKAEENIFGFLLFNDLSARDMQAWEYAPLGPFLSKNFGSIVSPWIVSLDALEPFRVKGPVQEPDVFPYLKTEGLRNFDINLEVIIKPENGQENIVCRSNFKYMYWNICQQLAHHTINGCNISVGDLYASGTISGPEPGSYGSMMELTWKGANPITLSDGSMRKFIHDNDTTIIRGFCEKDGLRIGFGECVTKILPAKE